MSLISTIEPIIYFDESKQLYNFPYELKFNSSIETIDFYFHEQDYVNQEEMLKERIETITESILNCYIMEQFLTIQKICLLEEKDIVNKEDLLIEINQRLGIIYYLSLLLKQIDTDKKDLYVKLKNILMELIECFILLEEYYIGTRKPELIDMKQRYLQLSKMF
jgi:hypothetical protein